MKKLVLFMFSVFAMLFFSGCATTTPGLTHHLRFQLDTHPQGAEIICDGKSLGFSPLVYQDATKKDWSFNDEAFQELDENEFRGLPSCKAKWVSGYTDFFPAEAKLNDFVYVKDEPWKKKIYLLTSTLTRKQGNGYEIDKKAENRYKKIASITQWDFKVIPSGAQILCDKSDDNITSVKNALKTGIYNIPKCKAIFVSGYEQFFKNSINIDTQDIKILTNQTIIRPNTKGYDKDMMFSLEYERNKKEQEMAQKQLKLQKQQAFEQMIQMEKMRQMQEQEAEKRHLQKNT